MGTYVELEQTSYSRTSSPVVTLQHLISLCVFAHEFMSLTRTCIPSPCRFILTCLADIGYRLFATVCHRLICHVTVLICALDLRIPTALLVDRGVIDMTWQISAELYRNKPATLKFRPPLIFLHLCSLIFPFNG
jgi:hypothetical protein